MPLLVLWTLFAQYSAHSHHVSSISFPSVDSIYFQQITINNTAMVLPHIHQNLKTGNFGGA